MSSITRKVFELVQRVIFREIGTRIRTDILKNLMDLGFGLFEKVGSVIPILGGIYIELYDDVIDREIEMARITKDDKVLVIGCGALPVTPVLIASKSNATVTCIDHDITVIKKAEGFIGSMGLSERVKVEYADGLGYRLEPFNVVLIVYGVKPPEKVLGYVAERIDNETRVILRTTIDNHGRLPFSIPDGLEVKKSIRLDSLGSVDSLLLVKKK